MTSPQPDQPGHDDSADPGELAGPWCRRIDTGWRATPLGVVLLPAGRADPVTVAGSAAAVWEMLAEPITRVDLADRLADRYGVAPATVQADLGSLLARLVELEAIERVLPSIS